jgi:predicted cupin superfamily sugar epimerase
MLTADEIVRLLKLQPHPVEGGYFRETYRSFDSLPAEVLPDHRAERSVGTAIYYLLTQGTLSEMHRLPGDEVFHFYLGDSVRQVQLYADGGGKEFTLGPDLSAGQVPQLVVPAGTWQGSHLLDGPHGYALLGATMAPGFDYADYETGRRGGLTARWRTFSELIEKLTPKG